MSGSGGAGGDERTLESRLDALEARLRRAEDELAILRLIAAYFPAVDSGRADEVAGLWTSEGVYDVDTGVLDGPGEIAAMVRGDEHQGLIAHGCGHLATLPHVVIDGDRAVATGHSQLVVRSSKPGRYSVVRVTANRWELARTAGGWRVEHRTARVLDDGGEGRELLAGDPMGDEGAPRGGESR